jgi:lipopolysaccharide export system protein LptA
MTLDAAVVNANSAVFTIADKRLSRGELEQATFENAGQIEGQPPVNGGAGKMVFDYAAGTLRLSDNAWVQKKGQYEVHGCDLIYNMVDRGVKSGSADCDQPFTIRMVTQPGAPPANAANEAPPQ